MRGRGQRVNSYTRACSNLADVLTSNQKPHNLHFLHFCTCCNTCCSVSGCADGRVEECPVLPAAVREGGRPAPPLPGGSHRHGGGGSPLRGGAVLQGKQARLREGQLTRDQRMEIQGKYKRRTKYFHDVKYFHFRQRTAGCVSTPVTSSPSPRR